MDKNREVIVTIEEIVKVPNNNARLYYLGTTIDCIKQGQYHVALDENGEVVDVHEFYNVIKEDSKNTKYKNEQGFFKSTIKKVISLFNG